MAHKKSKEQFYFGYPPPLRPPKIALKTNKALFNTKSEEAWPTKTKGGSGR